MNASPNSPASASPPKTSPAVGRLRRTRYASPSTAAANTTTVPNVRKCATCQVV